MDETVFVDITMWGRTAEVASEYLTKGSPVLIEGRLKLDTWEKDGKKNSKLKVVADKMQMLGSRSGGGGGGVGGGGRNGNANSANDETEFGAPPSDQGATARSASVAPNPSSGRSAPADPEGDIPF